MFDLNAAETEFRRAVALVPLMPFYHFKLGQVLLRLGRTPEGLLELERARDLYPAKLFYREQLLIEYLRANRPEAAAREFEVRWFCISAAIVVATCRIRLSRVRLRTLHGSA